ncbi:MAG: CbiQ family ECF transporter T component, partial [Actinomycetota bacterium]
MANTSRWRAWHPAEKVGPGFLLLLANLALPPWPMAAVTVGVTTVAATVGAGQSLARWLRTLAWPAGFVLAGVVGIGLVGGDGPGPIPLTVPDASLRAALATLARSVAGVSVVVLIGSTTPLVDRSAPPRSRRPRSGPT